MTVQRKNELRIRGARENNLRGVSLDIPHDKFTAITGLSGSGKSSLAFGTIYAEGQRRYIETFSPYTRQFLDKVKKPALDLIENVRPAIAIQQKTRINNSRSTVGSITNINDYLKVIWANLASPSCPSCGIELQRWNARRLSALILQRLRDHPERTVILVAPITLRAGIAQESARLSMMGFDRVFDLDSENIRYTVELEENNSKTLLVVIERFKGSLFNDQASLLAQITDSCDQAFALADGQAALISSREASTRNLCRISHDGSSRRLRLYQIEHFSSDFSCESQHLVIPRPTQGLFSANHPYGACPECKGFGRVLTIDRNKCVPDVNLSIEQNALQCWSGKSAKGLLRRLLRFCEKESISIKTPWKKLSAQQQEMIFTHRGRDFVGVLPWFKRLERKIYKMHVRVFLSRYRKQEICGLCLGARLRPEALAYRLAGKSLPDIWQMPLDQLLPWLKQQLKISSEFRHLPRGLEEVMTETISRLNYMIELGLPYLTLDRTARTLSGGETQRVNLASALGSELVSTHFVLDEPSVGLHTRDSARMLKAIKRLADKGNSVLVVEHDPECILAADHIIELGPYSGNRGGEIVFNGPRSQWDVSRIESRIAAKTLALDNNTLRINFENIQIRNLKNINVSIPLGRLVCLTGVSGSGKSTLAHEVIKRAFESRTSDQPLPFKVRGLEQIDSIAVIDQSPLSKTPRANVATYTDIWETIRTRLAASEDAQSRGLSKSSFSFNVNAGRCTACDGSGFIREDMQFLSDEFILCEVCLGKRFQPTILEVQLLGKNVHELLSLTVDQAAELFEDEHKIKQPCELLIKLGLGHLRLGHPLSELSGGEAQRLRLIPFIAATSSKPTLLVFDEPTTGLHMRDVARLVELFYSLRDRGHSILCIEHNLEVIKNSDWVIDLGPEGGEAGGQVVLVGPADAFLKTSAANISHTALALQQSTRTTNQQVKPTQELLAPKNELTIRGAREHNLKNISLSIPLDRIVALTGVSGSGKSTIAKDIIFAEGQRRYLDCLSPYARQFINELKRPDIDSISNVRPTICVQQHTFQPSRQSTIATMSEVSNYLRLLYSKVATQYCPDHPQQAISAVSLEEMAEQVLANKSRSIRILAPVIRNKKGHNRNIVERAQLAQIDELRVDGVLAPTRKFSEGLERNKPHSIEFVLARFNPQAIDRELVEQVLAQAISLGGGEVIVVSDSSEYVLSSERTCKICKKGYFRPDPEDLSFSSRRGACPRCQGSGQLNHGKLCPACGGSRLAAHARALRIAERNIAEVGLFTPPQLLSFLRSLEFPARAQALAQSISKELFARLDTLVAVGLDYLELKRECATLSGGELQRLRLATAIGSPLSGVLYIFDELSIGLHPVDNQAVLRLVRQLSDRGNSIIIIEHDPMTIRACQHVIDVGPAAGSAGGAIVANESILDFERRTDSVTALALREDSLNNPHAFLKKLAKSTNSRAATSSIEHLRIKNAYVNNLKISELKLPLGALVSVVGLSGAGKSSLLHAAIADTINLGKTVGAKSKAGATKWNFGDISIESDRSLTRALLVDQRPIGANSRSTPASFLGVFDEIRKLFALTLDAKARGWTQSFFSYNTGKGRCSTCKGQGVIKLEMNFLADAEMMCDSCRGKRYSIEADAVRYQGHSISDVLAMTFEQARSVFANHRKIHEPIRRCCELGLGYLALGQGSQTLSGGEAQRLKLAAELGVAKRSDCLYLFDEPTTGLHRHDVDKLVRALRSLVESGSSVMVIEHDSDLILSSDYILELGPGAGAMGGQVVFEGSPSELLKANTIWGRTLRDGIEDLTITSSLPKRLTERRTRNKLVRVASEGAAPTN